MDTMIKNVDEENWHFLKVQAAKEKATIGEMFNRIISEYKEKEVEDAKRAWNKIFSKPPIFTKEEAKKMHKASESFRKEYGFEG